MTGVGVTRAPRSSRRGPASDRLFFHGVVRDIASASLPRPRLERGISAALRSRGSRHVLITGPPGFGKTTLLARLCDAMPGALRYFVRGGNGRLVGSVAARECLIALGHQVRLLFPELGDSRLVIEGTATAGRVSRGARAHGVRIRELVASPFEETAIVGRAIAAVVEGVTSGVEIERLITEPRLLQPHVLQWGALIDPAELLYAREPGRDLVVVLDALEEGRFAGGGDSLADWLRQAPEMPPNVRLIPRRPASGDWRR